MDALLPSQPESYRQLIGRSFRLYKASFTRVILFAFLVSLIVFIPRLLSDVIGQDIFANLQPASPYRAWLFVIDMASLIFFIAILWRMHCAIHNIHEPMNQDFRKGVKKVLYVFIAAVIQSAIIFATAAIVLGISILLQQYDLIPQNKTLGISLTAVMIILQFVLIVYVFTLFYFYVPIIAIEDKGILASLERSVLLVWNHWWKVFSTQITPWISYLVLLFALRFGLKVNLHIYFLEYAAHNLWTTLLHLCIFALFIPWVAALLIVQLKDLELRKNIIESL